MAKDDIYIPAIPIEDIPKITFIDNPYEGLVRLRERLDNACKDGNLNKNKYSITFLTNNGLYKVRASIWMVGRNFVILKKNVVIPIKSITSLI